MTPTALPTRDQTRESPNKRTHAIELSPGANLRAGKLSAATPERRGSSQAMSSSRSPAETPGLLHAQTTEGNPNAPDMKGFCNGTIAYRQLHATQRQVFVVWVGIIAIVVIGALAVWVLWLKASGAVIEVAIPCCYWLWKYSSH